jgi:hypothetical protein
MNFKVFFEKGIHTSNDKRGRFISRIFGIFSEEIVHCWCKNPNSKYNCANGRPTIYEKDKHYTLDFTFIDKCEQVYIVEMKSEIQYQNYKFLTLRNDPTFNFFKNHIKKRAFQLFLNPGDRPIKIKGKELENIAGSILVWGRIEEKFNLEIFNHKMKKYIHNYRPLSDVLSVENMINDLLSWEDENYKSLVEQYKNWSNELYDKLLGE